jgi:hypothetical protein
MQNMSRFPIKSVLSFRIKEGDKGDRNALLIRNPDNFFKFAPEMESRRQIGRFILYIF